MRKRGKLSFLVVVLTYFMFMVGTSNANSFPFRAVGLGDTVPAVSLSDYKTQQETSLDQHRGKNLLVVFWGADIPTKKKRAIKALKAIVKLRPFLDEKGVDLMIVNAQGDGNDVIAEVMDKADLDMAVYTDHQQQAYGRLGIFVMPSVLLLDSDSKVVAGLGYSHDMGKRLQGEIEIMLGEKTRAQIEEELHPKIVEKSAAEKGADRHMHMAKEMVQRGQLESAIREFKKVVDIDAKNGEAYVQLGCLYLDVDKITEAGESLSKGMELTPDSLPGMICQARLKARAGELDDAIDDLQSLLMTNLRDNTLHYVLATLLEEKGEIAEAVKEYRQAYDLLEKKNHKR